MRKHVVIIFLFLSITSCNRDKEIRHLLNSDTPTAIIEGSYKAGESGDKKYIPLLLYHAYDPSASTSLRWKGFTVYTETMFALERILHIKPPHRYGDILESPDSVNVKFYSALWQKMNRRK